MSFVTFVATRENGPKKQRAVNWFCKTKLITIIIIIILRTQTTKTVYSQSNIQKAAACDEIK